VFIETKLINFNLKNMIKMYIDWKEVMLAKPEDARLMQNWLDIWSGIMINQTYISKDRITFK